MHVSPTALAAYNRRREFNQKIAAKAASLAAQQKPPAPAAMAIEPEAVPAEPDPPAAPMSERRWFWMAGEKFPEVRAIQEQVAQYYGVTRLDMNSARRTKDVVIPRQVAAYLAKQLTPLTLIAIGRRFGGRDHSTILNSVRKITRLVRSDASLALDVATLAEALTGVAQ